MKDRLPALDGLRGFAAMSVVLGHSAIWSWGVNSPLIQTILIALSAAHNAVQILFVLSGFLIAFLYPVVSNPVSFIKKRYGRIFPIYGTVVIFIWIKSFRFLWYQELIILIALGLVVNLLWKGLKNHSHIKNIGSKIFYTFVALQIAILLFNAFFTQRFILDKHIILPEIQKNFLNMITNLTFTTQIVRGIQASSGVFWSLGSELLFYILYPFIIVPIIHIAKKSGVVISIIMIIAASKILLDLDNAFASIASLNGMNIARANGFVAGVTIGTIYQSRGNVWKLLQRIISHPLFGLFSISLLILVQLGEHIVGLGSIGFMNIFYLITSWLIALVVLNAIVPNSLTYRIFSKRILTFLGLISYSLYLMHSEISVWDNSIRSILSTFISSSMLIEIITLILYITLSIGISYFLFKTVEFLYFASKNKVIATTQASYKEKVEDTDQGYSLKGYVVIITITWLALSFIYSGMYSPKLLINRHYFDNSNVAKDTEISLLRQDAVIQFTSPQENLSVIGFDMRYGGSAGLVRVGNDPSILKFELLDNQNHQLFSSELHAYEVEGSPRFQFGFPTIRNSKNIKYSVKLTLIGGKSNDKVLLNTSSTSFISISTINKFSILSSPLKILINRLVFIFTNPNYIFSVIFISMLIFLARRRQKL